MSARIPLGEREAQRLEFKAGEAQGKPVTISREVVAMLNAQGGEIWIGVREDEGIAVEAQGIVKPEVERLKLLDHLMETIEPRHRPEEVQVELVDVDPHDRSRGQLLRLFIRAQEGRKPFAALHQGGREYRIRVDHRMRPMTREEIFAAPAPAREDPEQVQLKRLQLLNEAVVLTEQAGLWIAVAPVPALRLDLQHAALSNLLDDPRTAGNRSLGWNYRLPTVPAQLRHDRVECELPGHRWTRVYEQGCIESWTTIRWLHHRTDDRQEIYPLALLEYVVSIARLAAHVFGREDLEAPQAVLLDGALLAPGWQLPAYAPGTMGYGNPSHGEPTELEKGRWRLPAPLRFEWDDFRSHPDHAGYLLVRQIYQAFGLREERIPQAYDRVQRHLVLPD